MVQPPSGNLITDQLTQAMADPGFYQQDAGIIAQAAQRLKDLEDELTSAYERWQALEGVE